MTDLKRKVPSADSKRVQKMKEEVTNPVSLKALNLTLNGDIVRRFKLKAIQEGVTMTEVIEQLILEYLDE